MKINRFLPCILSGIVLFVIGCGGSKTPPDLPKLYPCKITVIQDNKPLEDAIIFVRHDSGFSFAGRTDAKGVAVIKADGRWPGVPEGEHVITISKIVKPTDLPAPESMFSQEGRKYMEQLAKETKETVDLKYSDAKKSELRLKVGKKAVNETFDVGAAVAVSTAE